MLIHSHYFYLHVAMTTFTSFFCKCILLAVLLTVVFTFTIISSLSAVVFYSVEIRGITTVLIPVIPPLYEGVCIYFNLAAA